MYDFSRFKRFIFELLSVCNDTRFASRTQKLCFVCLLYMCVLQRDPMPKLCFVMVLTICKDFFADCKDFLS